MNPYLTPRIRRFAGLSLAVASLVVALALLRPLPSDSPPVAAEPARQVATPALTTSTSTPTAGITTRTDRNAFFAQLARRAGSPEPLPPSNGRPATSPVVRESQVTLEQNLLEFLSQSAGERAAHPFRLPTPDGREHAVEFTRTELMGENEGGVAGTIAGAPGSHVFLGYANDAVAGSWYVPGEGLFQIRYTGDGRHRVMELDPDRFLPEAMPYAPMEGAAPAAAQASSTAAPGAVSAFAPGHEKTAEAATPSADEVLSEAPPVTAPPVALDGTPAVEADVSTVIDVMVVYTPACKTANGGDSGISALINASITSANTAYSNSGASQSVRRVYAGEVSYTASGQLATDLPRLTNTSDGHMDNVHTLRNTYKADLVCLFVSTGTDAAGIAYLWTPNNSSVANYGFSVVMDVYAEANLTFAHELGHNMGCGHASGDGGGGAYSYSYGHKFSAGGTAYRTVMAYAPGTRIPYFSNPSVSYLGTATGHSTANNARTLGDSRAGISAYRAGITQWQEWSVVTSGDLNADNKPDLIFRSSSSGRVIAWTMDGTTSTGTSVLWAPSTAADTQWVPIACGDFNADNKTDIIWRNTATSRAIVWHMDGTTRTSTTTIWNPATAADALWVPYATGDLDADGKTDILWRNTSTGRVIVWYMNGTTRTGTAPVWTPATTADTLWVPVACGDFNADTKTDIFWRNTSSGRGIIWYMNGVTRTGTATVWAATGPTDYLWVPHAAGDFDASGGPDLIWRNSSTGRTIAWLLSGATTSSTAVIWSP